MTKDFSFVRTFVKDIIDKRYWWFERRGYRKFVMWENGNFANRYTFESLEQCKIYADVMGVELKDIKNIENHLL